MNTKWILCLVVCVVAALLTMGCGDEEISGEDSGLGIVAGQVDENGKTTLGATDWVEPGGKSDAIRGRQGLAVSVDSSDTAVWTVTNAWEDKNTAAARAEGLAWPAESGLTWEEKFSLWVDSMPKIERDGYGKTFMLTTPFGHELPAPALECAELAVFLRITFASWYNLPFFMEAIDGNRNRVFFGHFGVRTADGRYANTPRFRTLYEDRSQLAHAVRSGEREWPSDAQLAGRKLGGSFDDAQPMIGEGAHAGAYFDRIFLNKRVGYFLLVQLTYFGSINLADTVNTFNVAPEHIQAGDTLVHRWQRSGIGHALVVMRARSLGRLEVDGESIPQLEAETASGSMPRRQPLWESAAASKRNFTNAYGGGDGYEDFMGGLKRWRAAAKVGGRWTNVVPAVYADHFVNSTHRTALGARPDRFDQVLSDLTPTQKLAALAEVIEASRAHLRNYPASCAARTRREAAFKDLYEVGAEAGMSRYDVDAQYRLFEDYVFAELVYAQSKTCCWNSSTPKMYELAVEYNLNAAQDAETGQCRQLTVFKARDDGGDGFEVFRQYAAGQGVENQWVAWSADERCPQAGIPADTEAEHLWTPFCSVHEHIEF